MDPQKRTVINQLLSHCCWITMLFNITTFPIVVFSRLLGMVVPVVEFDLMGDKERVISF